MLEEKNKNHPDIKRANSRVLFSCDEEDKDKIKEIRVGHVKLREKDSPSGIYMAEYIGKSRYMDLIALFDDHNKYFPVLFLIVPCKASRRVVEVSCKRFFGLMGNISRPRSTRLGMRI